MLLIPLLRMEGFLTGRTKKRTAVSVYVLGRKKRG